MTANTHAASTLFLTDGGIETSLMEDFGWDLPEFAACTLISQEDGLEQLEQYYEQYVTLSGQAGVGMWLDTPTWRASARWAARLGCSTHSVREINEKAVDLARRLRQAARLRSQQQNPTEPVPEIRIAGVVGPRTDEATSADSAFESEDEAARYHLQQITALADAGVDVVSAVTIADAREAIGIVQAAHMCGVPVTIAFTLEGVGTLPGGLDFAQAVSQVDKASDNYAEGFLINCAEPAQVPGQLPAAVEERFIGVRLNAGQSSAADFARDVAALRAQHPNLRIFGGCCGTNTAHLHHLADELTADVA